MGETIIKPRQIMPPSFMVLEPHFTRWLRQEPRTKTAHHFESLMGKPPASFDKVKEFAKNNGYDYIYIPYGCFYPDDETAWVDYLIAMGYPKYWKLEAYQPQERYEYVQRPLPRWKLTEYYGDDEEMVDWLDEMTLSDAELRQFAAQYPDEVFIVFDEDGGFQVFDDVSDAISHAVDDSGD